MDFEVGDGNEKTRPDDPDGSWRFTVFSRGPLLGSLDHARHSPATRRAVVAMHVVMALERHDRKASRTGHRGQGLSRFRGGNREGVVRVGLGIPRGIVIFFTTCG